MDILLFKFDTKLTSSSISIRNIIIDTIIIKLQNSNKLEKWTRSRLMFSFSSAIRFNLPTSPIKREFWLLQMCQENTVQWLRSCPLVYENWWRYWIYGAMRQDQYNVGFHALDSFKAIISNSPDRTWNIS